jgi:hypothetical protein
MYAISKSEVSGDYYETPLSTDDLYTSFNEKIAFVHVKELEEEALDVVREWEKENSGV